MFERYLRLLGCERPPALRKLVRRHLCRVPFENVSKLVLQRPVSLPEFLDGIEHRDLGGTCYSSNPYLYELLRYLGYDVDLLAADMTTPNVHTSMRVRLAGLEYHVDVGYAAPFYEPIRLDLLPHEIVHGDQTFVLSRGHCPGTYEMAHLRRGERVHGYVVHPPPRVFEFFRSVILDSFEAGRTFMTCLRITRFFEDRAVELRNRTLIRYTGSGCTEVRLNGIGELEHAVATEFAMPRCPVRQAVEVLEQVNGRRLFD